MDTHALIIAASGGFGCMLAGFALSRRSTLPAKLPADRSFVLAAILLPVLLFLVTFPVHGKIFAPGHDLGNGILIGALGALLAAKITAPMWGTPENGQSILTRSAILSGALGVAVLSLCGASILHFDTFYVVVLGTAIGWIVSASLLFMAIYRQSDGHTSSNWPIWLLIPAGFVSAVAAGMVLGSMRTANTHVHAGLQLPQITGLLLAVSVPFVILVGALLSVLVGLKGSSARLSPVIQGVGALAALFGSTKYIDKFSGLARDSVTDVHGLEKAFASLTGGSHLIQTVLLGVVSTLLCTFLCSQSSQGQNRDHVAVGRSAFALITVLTSSLLAFQLLSGFGVAAAAISGFVTLGTVLVLLPQLSNKWKISISTIAAMLFAIIGMSLYRLFFSLYDGNFPLSPYTDQYAVFGLGVGIALPVGISNMAISLPKASHAWAAYFRLVCAAICAIAVPASLLILWGNRCSIAFLTSASLSAALMSCISLQADDEASVIRRSAVALVGSVAIPLFVCEWAHYAIDSGFVTRESKEHFALIIGSGLAIVIVILAVVKACGEPAETEQSSQQGTVAK